MYVPHGIKYKVHFRRYHHRLELGLCPRCGNRRDGEWIHCTACLERSSLQKYMRGTKTVEKQRSRLKYKAENLCVECGQPAVEGLIRCQHHRNKKREYDSTYRVNRVLRLIKQGAI